jgi:hypothetical protein
LDFGFGISHYLVFYCFVALVFPSILDFGFGILVFFRILSIKKPMTLDQQLDQLPMTKQLMTKIYEASQNIASGENSQILGN